MKLPVFKAIGASIAYIITHFPTIVKILWLPTLAFVAVEYAVTPKLLDAQMQMMTIDPNAAPGEVFAAMAPMIRPMGLLYLAMAIFIPMKMVGLLRHLLRGEAPRLPFYLSFGFSEIRIIAAFILLIIMVGILYVGGIIAMLAIIAVAGIVSNAAGGVIAILAMFAWFGVLTWFLVRMSLIYPASVGAREIGIAESWNITAGSFWSLFFFWLLWGLLMVALGAIVLLVFAGAYWDLLVQLIQSASEPGAEAEMQRKILEMQRSMFDLSTPKAVAYAAVVYMMSMIGTALWVVPSGVAYRYLSGTERGA